LDYKKLILYLVVILVAVGIWFINDRNEKSRLAESERFAEIYAGTSVMAELYRTDPARFFSARDSILAAHGVDSAWVRRFKDKFEGHEEKWTGLWDRINIITDSLIKYFKEHPVIHDTTTAGDTSAIPAAHENSTNNGQSSHQ
jgi:hypothetical protein